MSLDAGFSRWWAGGLLGLFCLGCPSPRLLKLENDLLKYQNAELQAQLVDLRSQAAPGDFARVVNLELVQSWMARAGLNGAERASDGLLVVGISGDNARFRVSAQLFPEQKVLYLAAVDYLELEAATSSSAMVLLLTQLAAINYELLLGKFQLNPRTGAITLSVELKLDDGLGYASFASALQALIRTADGRYPELAGAARGQGI